MKISTLILTLCTLGFAACAGAPKKSGACCSEQSDKCCAKDKAKACPGHSGHSAPTKKKSS